MLGLLIWQVILGHPWGEHPMSNANVIGWTVFLWLIYFRLITVRLVTEVRKGDWSSPCAGCGGRAGFHLIGSNRSKLSITTLPKTMAVKESGPLAKARPMLPEAVGASV